MHSIIFLANRNYNHQHKTPIVYLPYSYCSQHLLVVRRWRGSGRRRYRVVLVTLRVQLAVRRLHGPGVLGTHWLLSLKLLLLRILTVLLRLLSIQLLGRRVGCLVWTWGRGLRAGGRLVSGLEILALRCILPSRRYLVLTGRLSLDGLLLWLRNNLLGLVFLLRGHEWLLVFHLVVIRPGAEQEAALLAAAEEHHHAPGKGDDEEKPMVDISTKCTCTG